MGRRGSVLVLALWTLLVLGFLAVAVGGYVSANMRIANHAKYSARAHYLAQAGVQLAVAEIMRNPTNINESLFAENASLPGGTFSVLSVVTNDAAFGLITNIGWVAEADKINLDDSSQRNQDLLVALLDALGQDKELAKVILGTNNNLTAQKEIDKAYQDKYGLYDSPAELLLVDGVDGNTFAGLEPFVTVQQYQIWYGQDSNDKESKKYRRDSYGGLAQGKAVGDNGIAALQRIAFVFDRATTNFLYWREH
ncbi:MAG: hypothetical protein O3A51_03620 [Verrucomicrobia bacterium]|nr:hypothetical protein [Verrucomicrobiota bacterium]